MLKKKIGTKNGEYTLNSKLVMIEMNDDAPVDALPCGFEGFQYREYAGVRPPFPLIKYKYYIWKQLYIFTNLCS